MPLCDKMHTASGVLMTIVDTPLDTDHVSCRTKEILKCPAEAFSSVPSVVAVCQVSTDDTRSGAESENIVHATLYL